MKSALRILLVAVLSVPLAANAIPIYVHYTGEIFGQVEVTTQGFGFPDVSYVGDSSGSVSRNLIVETDNIIDAFGCDGALCLVGAGLVQSAQDVDPALIDLDLVGLAEDGVLLLSLSVGASTGIELVLALGEDLLYDIAEGLHTNGMVWLDDVEGFGFYGNLEGRLGNRSGILDIFELNSFHVSLSPHAVPEPGPLTLLGAGLIALVVLRRKSLV